MKKRHYIYMVTAALLLLSVFITFLRFINDFIEMNSYTPHSDAIVVLTGGVGRVEEGFRLFRDGKGKILIISGVESSSNLNAIFPGRKLNQMVDTSKIILDVESRSTVDNAVNVNRIVEAKALKSITLVTSNYHAKRAFSIFRAIMNQRIAVYNHPVEGPNFKADRWWEDMNSMKLVLSEYFKYCWFQIWHGSL